MAKRLTRNTLGSKYSNDMNGELSRKEKRMIVRSWEGFWDLSRVLGILRDAGVFDRFEKKTARNLLVKALEKSRDVFRETERYPMPLPLLSVYTGSADRRSRPVTSFVVVGAVNIGGVAKYNSIGALFCSAGLLVSI
jgi:hypothetical protein